MTNQPTPRLNAEQRADSCYQAAREIGYIIERHALMAAALFVYNGPEMARIAEIQAQKFSLFHHTRQCWEAAHTFTFGYPDQEPDPIMAENCATNARIAVEQLHTLQMETRDMIESALVALGHRVELATAEAFRDAFAEPSAE